MNSVARGLTQAERTFFTGGAHDSNSFETLNAHHLGDLEEDALATAAAAAAAAAATATATATATTTAAGAVTTTAAGAGAAQSMAPPNRAQTERVKKRVINLTKSKEAKERPATEFEEGDYRLEARAYLESWEGYHHFNQPAKRQGEIDVANSILYPSEEFVRRALYSADALSSIPYKKI